MPASALHASPYAGSWYPADPVELSELLDQLWAKSETRTGTGLLPGGLAYVVPHAGLVYSGTVAAAVYRHLELQRPDRVIIAGFAHRGSPPGIYIPRISGYRTPLGEIPVDTELVDQLLSEGPFRPVDENRVCDHSIEIQLPLLQKAVPEARVAPLYVSALDASTRAEAARMLAACLGPRTVLLASSDFTHFGRSFGFMPFPVDWSVADRLRRLDFEVIEAASSLSPQFFLDTLQETEATVCGYHPISLALAAVSALQDGEEIFQHVLDYQTSGEITGDYHHSVSYAALGYFPCSSYWLDPQDQKILLDLARRTLQHYRQTGSRRPPAFPPSARAALQRRVGLFVTLHQDGKLRGCIGNTHSQAPLEVMVPEMTLASALDDPRFEPLSPDETGIEIEISILTPMKRLLDVRDFRVGQHGALIRLDDRQGLLLPQVATERGWNAEQFLEALGLKAGAGQHAWRDPHARLYVFRAQVIQ